MLSLQTWLTQKAVKSLTMFDVNEEGQVLLAVRVRSKGVEKVRTKFYSEKVCPETGLEGPKQTKAKRP